MPTDVSISRTLSIRECGKDEVWLQDQIAANPSILGLGDLVLVEREKRQLSGGRLDLLLKSRDGESVFEVEVMLGDTDGSHIHRAIEYWDLEESLDPKRKHFPVLIAEEVTRRFFNVIYRLARSIPIIAIRANMIGVENKQALHFTTILNAYESSRSDHRRPSEPANSSGPRELSSEAAWVQKSPLVVECAKKTRAAILSALPDAKLKFCKFGLIITVGSRTYFWFTQKGDDKALLNFWVDKTRAEETQSLLRKCGLSPSEEDGYVRTLVTPKAISANTSLFEQLGPMVDSARRTSNQSFK